MRHAAHAIAMSLLLTSSVAAAAAAPPRQMTSAEIARAIERLGVVRNVLYVAAHPDDENTTLLAWLANEKLVRAAYLSLTRGEGGQNLIGSEQGPLLGLIRTQELLAARRVDGAEQFFTRARDFGYSKTWDETLRIWDKDAVLADVVQVIRQYKPDVIITRFPPPPIAKPGDTHGHHTSSAILAEAAFKAAADPGYLPEQVQQYGTWQAKRILWNRSSWSMKPGEDLSSFIKLDIGAYNPALGASYGEIAAESRSMHKSQGFGVARTRGPLLEYFKPLDGDAPKTGILDGIDWTWARVKGAEKLAALFARARAEYRPESPAASIPVLLQAWDELDRLPDDPATRHFKAQKQRELGDVIANCAGLHTEAVATDYDAVPGTQLAVTALALARANAPLQLSEVRFAGTGVPVGKTLPANEPVQIEHKLAIPANADYTNPYWLADPPAPGTWTVRDRNYIGMPEQPAALSAEFVFKAGTRTFTITRSIAYKWVDPVAGERWRSVEIVPAVAINPEAPVRMFGGARAEEARFALRAAAPNASGTARLELPAGWSAQPKSIPFQIAQKGGETEIAFRVTPPAAPARGPFAPIAGTARAVVDVNGATLSRGLVRVEHGHIPIQTLLPPAEVKLVRFALEKQKKRIAYIPGAGDEVPAALRQVGYEVTMLSDEALRDRSDRALRDYQAIVVGVRAFNVNPRLPYFHDKLMDYVKAGGTLLVQYNTNNRLSKLPANLGPYPFEVSQDRVTDENAPVDVVGAKDDLLKAPNTIDAADFAGWVQERGLYFANKWDDKYETPLAMNDPGEPPKKGSLLVGRFGKGTFIYTGLAFFRQLPAGVPGAYRLFANLIDHGRAAR